MSIIKFSVILVLIACKPQQIQSKLDFLDVSPRGYSQRVEVKQRNLKTVYISGQVAVDENGELVGAGDLEVQTDQVFKNIKSLVEKSGGTMDNLVNIDCYFTDISQIAKFRTARDKYTNLQKPPASTAVQVQRLINTDFLIEINATAVIPVENKETD